MDTTPLELPLSLGLKPPLIKDAAEPPGLPGAVRELVEPAKERERLSFTVIEIAAADSVSLNVAQTLINTVFF